MKLRFRGLVSAGDECRVEPDEGEGAILIGGVDLVGELSDCSGKVTFGIADETFEGDLFVETGWGYSEWTPMESDTLRVGDHDMIKILRRYMGKEITLFVFNEPANILDDDEWEDVAQR